MDDIDRIFKNSEKAELLETLTEELEADTKVIIVLINDKEDGKYTSQVMTLGISTSYEACGILTIGESRVQGDW